MLETYVTAWEQSLSATLELLDQLPPEQWAVPTDLPGWDVRDVVAHLAHLEAVLAGHAADDVPNGDGTVVSSHYTEAGVLARRDTAPARLLTELRTAHEARRESLQQLPDPTSRPATTPASVSWTWDTLLRNRVVDAWCHEQDIRRAVGAPGGMGSLGAQVTVHTLAAGLPYVLGKKVAPPSGTSVRWLVSGEVPLDVTLAVGDDGRAGPSEADPATTLTMDTETFAVLAAGRRRREQVQVEVAGDADLAARVLDAMAVTP